MSQLTPAKLIAQVDLINGILDYHYNKKELENGMFKFALKFVQKHLNEISDSKLTNKANKIIQKKSKLKYDICFICALPLSNKHLFGIFKSELPQDVQSILEKVVWSGFIDEETLEEELQIEIRTTNQQSYYSSYDAYKGVKPSFRFFKVLAQEVSPWRYDEFIFGLVLPMDLCKILGAYFEKPAIAFITPLESAPDTSFIYADGDTIIAKEWPRIMAYLQQGQIKTNKKNRPLSSTYSKMQRKLDLHEFFPNNKNKLLKSLRTSLIAGVVVQYPQKKDQGFLSTFEHLFKTWFTQSNYRSTPNVLHYIKGMNQLKDHQFFRVETRVLDLLKELPVKQWISFENLYMHCYYHFKQFNPIPIILTKDYLYFELDDPDSLIEKEKYYIDDVVYYQQCVSIPYLQGMFFYLGAFGWLDLAYEAVDVSELGLTVMSPYQGLKAVRLTNLGAYLLGQQDKYTPTYHENPIVFSPSETTLTILVNQKSETADAILRPFTQKVSARRYKTNAALFLKDCNTKSDLETKIKLFKDSIQEKLPANWQTFFTSLKQKIDPFQKVSNMIVLRVPPDNKTLLHQIIHDPIIQKLTVKAEGFHLLIAKSDYPAFKKRLNEFGYLITK